MTPDDRHERNVRRITLPSGRSIEVVRYPQESIGTRELHVCPICASDLVQPIAWNEEPDAQWQLTLECPNCAWIEHGIYDREQVERLEDRLDEGLCAMIADLHRLTQANMAADVERFVSALQADHILPEDF